MQARTLKKMIGFIILSKGLYQSQYWTGFDYTNQNTVKSQDEIYFQKVQILHLYIKQIRPMPFIDKHTLAK
jgi:hypothetical protein